MSGRHDFPLPVPSGEDVQELLRRGLQGCRRRLLGLTTRTICARSSPWCTKSSMVEREWAGCER